VHSPPACAWTYRTEAIISAYNITDSAPLPFKAVDNPDKTKSKEPGSGIYANVTLPPHSLRYICG
jgi:hypothetical protein